MTNNDPFKSLETTNPVERRTWPRLTLSTEQIRLSDGKIYGVADISATGMAIRILNSNDLIHFSVGALIEGHLNIRRQKYPVRARVRHVGKDLVGCQFDSLTPDVQKTLNQMLDPSLIGAGLKPIPTQDLHLWYHGSSGTEFMIYRAYDGTIQKISILVLGNLVQWQEEQGLITGVVESSFDESETLGVTRFETLLFKQDAHIDLKKCNMAKALIQHCALPGEMKKTCIRHLELPEQSM